MIDGYTTVREIAMRWNISPRTVQIMCAEGRIPGATKFGQIWAIPADAIKPTDKRITSGKYRDWRKHIKMGDQA